MREECEFESEIKDASVKRFQECEEMTLREVTFSEKVGTTYFWFYKPKINYEEQKQLIQMLYECQLDGKWDRLKSFADAILPKLLEIETENINDSNSPCLHP